MNIPMKIVNSKEEKTIWTKSYFGFQFLFWNMSGDWRIGRYNRVKDSGYIWTLTLGRFGIRKLLTKKILSRRLINKWKKIFNKKPSIWEDTKKALEEQRKYFGNRR